MSESWKRDIVRAIWITAIVAIVAIIVNQVRTPILIAASEQGKITRASAERMSGVKLIDSWWHGGWPHVAKDGERTQQADDVESNGQGSTYQVEVPRGPEGQVWLADLYQAKALFDSGECIFFDAREAEYYEDGHIAGSLNWPYERFDQFYDEYIETVPKDTCVVVYCIGGACDESYQLGTSLVLEGFREVYLYDGGMQEWEIAEFPITVGSEP